MDILVLYVATSAIVYVFYNIRSDKGLVQYNSILHVDIVK